MSQFDLSVSFSVNPSAVLSLTCNSTFTFLSFTDFPAAATKQRASKDRRRAEHEAKRHGKPTIHQFFQQHVVLNMTTEPTKTIKISSSLSGLKYSWVAIRSKRFATQREKVARDNNEHRFLQNHLGEYSMKGIHKLFYAVTNCSHLVHFHTPRRVYAK